MSFKEIKPEELNFNPFTRIGSDWMLLTAGTEDKFNTMTASWGGAGVFWQTGCYLLYPSPTLHQRICRQRRTLLRQLFKRRTPRCPQTLRLRIWP